MLSENVWSMILNVDERVVIDTIEPSNSVLHVASKGVFFLILIFYFLFLLFVCLFMVELTHDVSARQRYCLLARQYSGTCF